MYTLKLMADCAWQTTVAYLDECESPAEVALTFSVALRAIAEYQALRDEKKSGDSAQEFGEVRMVDLDECPGFQYLQAGESFDND